jgi:4-hydroxybenzoate polyprenyltransferase
MDQATAGRLGPDRARRARTLLRLGRVSNLPTVWSNCLCAAGLASSQADVRLALIGALSASAIYTGGMFLNDAFDQQHDALFAAQRPIPSGAIGGRTVYALGYLQLGLGVLGVALPAVLGWELDLAALASVFALACMVVVYNAWHKGNPVSPLLMAACRALVYLTLGCLVSEGFPRPMLWLGMLVLMLYVMGLTWIAKLESRGLSLRVIGGFASLIACISVVDALLLCSVFRFDWAFLASLGFPATLALQRWVRGT